MNFSQIDFGVFSLKIYGVFLSIGFLLASLHFYRCIQKNNFSVDFFIHHYWRWLLGGALLGRLFATLLNPDVFQQYGIFSFFAFWEGDLNFYGLAIGFVLTMYIDIKKHKKSFWKWADLGVGSFILGVLVMDFAAFLTGAIYGKETALPWGIQYETFGVEIINPVHPVTLYALFFHLLLFFWGRKVYEKYSKTPGRIFLKFSLLFFFTDFLLLFIHGNQAILFYELRIGQWIDLFIVFACLWILYAKKLRKKT